MVTGGLIAHPIEAAPELLRFYRDAVADAPDDLTVFAGLVHAPDGSGAKLAALVVFHAGDPEAAERELAPFKAFGSPLMAEVGPMPYPVMNTLLDAGFPDGRAQLLALELHPRPAGRADRHGRRAVRHRPLADDVDPVRALPRRRDPRRGERDRRPAPRARLEPPRSVRVDRPGRHRRQHPLDPRDVRRPAAAPRRPAAGSTTSATTRATTPSGPPTAPTTSGSARSSAATTPTTSSTSTTTVGRAGAMGLPVRVRRIGVFVLRLPANEAQPASQRETGRAPVIHDHRRPSPARPPSPRSRPSPRPRSAR